MGRRIVQQRSQPTPRHTSTGRLSAFEPDRQLGKGSYGEVFKVRALADGFDYALKSMSLRDFSPRERKEALNEIRLLASLYHPSIVRYCESFVEASAPKLCFARAMTRAHQPLAYALLTAFRARLRHTHRARTSTS